MIFWLELLIFGSICGSVGFMLGATFQVVGANWLHGGGALD
jgi:hypothetical protein